MVTEMAADSCVCLCYSPIYSIKNTFLSSSISGIKNTFSMSHPHLAHKLPWAELGRVVKRVATPLPGNPKFRLQADEEKVVDHFAKCLASTIAEFAATDKSSAEVKKYFDPEQAWGGSPWNGEVQAHQNFYYPGYLMTIIHNYIVFNLIVLEPDVFVPLIMTNDGRPSHLMEYAYKKSKGHPDWLVEQLIPAFYYHQDTRGYKHLRLKPVTAEVLDILREQCKHLFRCLYSLSGDNASSDWVVVRRSMAINFFHKKYLREYAI
ncbi:hypothetical protein Poli38472_006661 [Pythium oligandrum]|uniref:Uncharacterized protein n=1 Tax=Pythium oligandrum TaxID=41045 RepID=A0A8K1C567_PYTOL|nr:hypothetical protein Poli38472_006661 [Pythium oligandrum]|eukprot:TMW56651.1 hypothetical protein Poli38472_006661 [Pythium oligandrum]